MFACINLRREKCWLCMETNSNINKFSYAPTTCNNHLSCNIFKRVDEVVRHPHLVTQDQFTQVLNKVSDIHGENSIINIELFRHFSQVIELVHYYYISHVELFRHSWRQYLLKELLRRKFNPCVELFWWRPWYLPIFFELYPLLADIFSNISNFFNTNSIPASNFVDYTIVLYRYFPTLYPLLIDKSKLRHRNILSMSVAHVGITRHPGPSNK